MKAMKYNLVARSSVSALLLAMLGVSIFIVCTPVVKEVVSLQGEADCRRAISEEEIWGWQPVGVFNAFCLLLLPLWMSAGMLILGGIVIGEKKPGYFAKSCLVACCVILAVAGVALFISTPECDLNIWGLSILRFLPLMLSAFPAGILSCTVSRKIRWLPVIPTIVGYFILLFYIANCTSSI